MSQGQLKGICHEIYWTFFIGVTQREHYLYHFVDYFKIGTLRPHFRYQLYFLSQYVLVCSVVDIFNIINIDKPNIFKKWVKKGTTQIINLLQADLSQKSNIFSL